MPCRRKPVVDVVDGHAEFAHEEVGEAIAHPPVAIGPAASVDEQHKPLLDAVREIEVA